MLHLSGPLLIAANHPNSFLDAIIVSTLFKKPVYSLARGDAFAGKFINFLLSSLNMLPVYRITEGSENLDKNYDTFDACQELFQKGQVVLIFSEGRCVNEWHLRPLKKGTARLALTAWLQNVPLKVLPLGINYSSFRKFGKVVKLDFGDLITSRDMYEDLATGKAILEFNSILKAQLESLVIESKPADTQKLIQIFNTQPSSLKKTLLFLPAVLGFILHAPLYYASHLIVRNRAKDHYDSVMVGIFFLFYPLFVLLGTFLLYVCTGSWLSLLFMLIAPASALALLHIKNVFGMGR